MITTSDYFLAYAGHPEITPEIEGNAERLVERVNTLLSHAVAEGWEPRRNPVTGTLVSGERNGGWRPQDCPVGAPRSKHKLGQGVDIYDPGRRLASWTLANIPRLIGIGLWIEDPRWTTNQAGLDGWVHYQCAPPGNPPIANRVVFIPDNTEPLAGNPPKWEVA